MSAFPGYLLSSNFPSRNTVVSFTEDLINCLFPMVGDAAAYIEQQCSANTLLRKQLIEILTPLSQRYALDVEYVTNAYLNDLAAIKAALIQDAELILEFDPAAYSVEEVILSYPGFYAIMIYRLTHPLYKLAVPILPRMMSELAHSKTG
ncbi:MAG: serine O-acetyltransferase, partial [Lacibacter sp.]